MKFPIIRAYLWTALLSVVIIGIFFQKYALFPNDYLYTNYGDGIKNYFTEAYYLRYDSGVTLSGMNYPFGEHIVYTDNQPLVSGILVLLRDLGLPSHQYIVGITNVLMLISFVACSLIMFSILRKTGLPVAYSVICALIISFLSPQIMNLSAGGFALAYSPLIPLCWLLYIKFEEEKGNLLWPLLLFLSVLGGGLLHPYYFAMMALLVICLVLIHYLQNKQRRKSYLFYSISVLSAILPLVLFKVFLRVTDSEIDRPENPWGFFECRTTFEGAFLPNVPPFSDVWHFFVNAAKPWASGYVYVGFPGLLVLIFSLIKIYKYVRAKQYVKIIKPVLPHFLRYSLWAAILMLLFAMTIPFYWNMEFLLDLMPFLKQFRAMGRFAWGFYYIFTVFTAVYFYQVFRYLRMNLNSHIAYTILVMVLLSWSLGAWSVLLNTKNQVDLVSAENKLHEKNFPMYPAIKNAIGEKEYQALLVFPFFMIGTEKIDHNGDYLLNAKAMAFSYHAHIPMVNVMLARTSSSKAFEKLELLNKPYLPKSYLSKVDKNKEMLIMVGDKLSDAEELILEKAQFIADFDSIKFYSIVPSKLYEEPDNLIAEFLLKKDSLNQELKVFKAFESSDFVYNSFNDEKRQGIIGNSKEVGDSGEKYKLVWKGKIPGAVTGKEYKISWWWLLDMSHPGYGKFRLYEKSPSGETTEKVEVSLNNNPIEVLGKWVRLEHTFSLSSSSNTLMVDVRDESAVIDELLIWPATEDVYTNVTDSGFYYNNFPVFRSRSSE